MDNKTTGIVGMPFHLNNVDMTVNTNFLYGASQAILEELNDGAPKKYFINNPSFQKLYQHTAAAVR